MLRHEARSPVDDVAQEAERLISCVNSVVSMVNRFFQIQCQVNHDARHTRRAVSVR